MTTVQDLAALSLARHDPAYNSWGLIYAGDAAGLTSAALGASSVGMVVLSAQAAADVAQKGAGAETLWGAQQIQAYRSAGKVVLTYLDLAKVNTYTAMWNGSWTGTGFADSGVTSVAPAWVGGTDTVTNSLGQIVTATTTRRVNFSASSWLEALKVRVDALMAAGGDGLFLDDVGAYFNQIGGQFVANPSNLQKAVSARAMRDLVIALRQYIDSKSASGTRFKLLVNADPSILVNTSADNSAPDTVRNAQFLKAIDGLVLENQVSLHALNADSSAGVAETVAQTTFAANGVPVLSIDTVRSAADATPVIADALAHGFLPYVAQGTYSVLSPTFTTDLAQSSQSGIVVQAAPPLRVGAGAQLARFVVTRVGSLAQGATVTWQAVGSAGATTLVGAGGEAVSDEAAGAADFVGGVLPSGSVSLAAGVASATISASVNGAAGDGHNRGFVLQLAATGGSLVTPSVGGVVLDTSVHALLRDTYGGYAQFDAPSAAVLAATQPLLDAVGASIAGGNVDFSVVGADGAIGTGTAGRARVLRVDAPVAVAMPAGVATVATNVAATITGGAAAGQLVVGGAAGIAFNAGAGAGTVLAGGGANLVSMYQGAGGQNVRLGDGADTVVALGGDSTVDAGGGANTIFLGSGRNVVRANGNDLIAGGSGAATVTAGAGNPVVFFGAGDTHFVGGTGRATVVAGAGAATVAAHGGTQIWLGAKPDVITTTGADTVIGAAGAATVSATAGNALAFAGTGTMLFTAGTGVSTVVGNAGGTVSMNGGAGTLVALGYGRTVYQGGAGVTTLAAFAGSATVQAGGGGIFVGGPGGSNSLVGGTGTSIFYGGGNGDTLAAGAGSRGDVLVAGGGAETLTGAGTAGAHSYYGGTGPDLIMLGSGSSQVLVGSGVSTIVAGSGLELFAFFSGRASQVLFQGFNPSLDYLSLQGFASGEAARALASAVISAGSETLALADGTRITFQGVTGLKSANFLGIG
jgi:endo-alpha-1,4-polygalactosaminidase (GH114 family)